MQGSMVRPPDALQRHLAVHQRVGTLAGHAKAISNAKSPRQRAERLELSPDRGLVLAPVAGGRPFFREDDGAARHTILSRSVGGHQPCRHGLDAEWDLMPSAVSMN